MLRSLPARARRLGVPRLLSTAVSSSSAALEPRDFSFSGSGFLLSFHLGAAHELRRAGLITDRSRFAGASGGAIAALALAARVDEREIQGEARRMAALCRAEGTLWKLEPRLRAIFAAKFAACDVAALGRRLTIATERLWPARRAVRADAFESLEDLGDALIASCFIPFYLAPRASALFRGQRHVDGGLLTLVPELPGFVKVCCFPAALLRRPDYDISPSLDPESPFSALQLVRFALFPPEPQVLDELFALGEKCARIWVQQQQQQQQQQQSAH